MMTDYEQATLELMQREHILNAMGQFDSQQEMVAIYGSMFITLLFGYLVVAYLAGKNLSKTQVSIFTTLYCMSALGSMSIMTGNYTGMASMWEYTDTLIQELGIERIAPVGDALISEGFIIGTMIINFGSVMASLFFMWTVRHPKTE
jgi:hypothetical protein